MFNKRRHTIEALEARIAPAAVVAVPIVKQAELAYDASPSTDHHFVHASVDTPILLQAGQVLTTGNGARSGQYLMFVEKGQALVFTTDLNHNGQVDYNEITGIAAGDGLRLTSFVDIHGDIVTNLDSDGTLSDSDNNSTNNPVSTKGDGLILNNSRIERITLRGLQPAELTDQNADKIVDNADVDLRLELSSYSIFGQILAGKGFGVVGDTTSGLHIDDSGKANQLEQFTEAGADLYTPFKSSIGSIRTGTAAGGEYFSFGYSNGADVHPQGTLFRFLTPNGQTGGDISYVSSVDVFNVSGFYTGNGGVGARGGDISDVALNGDNASGYKLVAGDGGRGSSGGMGGSIFRFTDLGSVTGQVLLQTGDGGLGANATGGNGGTLGFGDVIITAGDTTAGTAAVHANISVNAGMDIVLGSGGAGFRGGGTGASLTNAVVKPPDGDVTYGLTVVGTTHTDLSQINVATHQVTSHNVIGRGNTFDINGDGFDDLVYTTTAPDQLVVRFGDGNGHFLDDTLLHDPTVAGSGYLAPLYLDGPSNATAVAVGDVNGDGYFDVVVGSNQSGDFSGITVFLGKFEDSTHNGLTATEDVDGNGINGFLGFASPRFSPLPSLAEGDSSTAGAAYFEYSRSSNPINSIALGDFNGDGYVDIGVSATYESFINGLNQVIIVLSPTLEVVNDPVNGAVPTPNGHFFADMGTKSVGSTPAVGKIPFAAPSLSGIPFGGNDYHLESTALSITATHDTLIGISVPNGTLTIGGVKTTEQDSFLSTFDFSVGPDTSPVVAHVVPGNVDTNRDVGGDKVSLNHDQFLLDFAVVDFNNDDNADIIALTQVPRNFLTGNAGDGTGTFAPVLSAGGDQSGFYYGNDSNTLGIQGAFHATNKMTGVMTLDTRGSFLNAGIYFGEFDASGTYGSGAFVSGRTPTTQATGDDSVVAFDYFTSPDQYALASPNKSALNGQEIELSFGLDIVPGVGTVPYYYNLADNHMHVFAGDGGAGIIGSGGNAGSVGVTGKTALTVSTSALTGSFDFTFPNNIGYNGEVQIFGGRGGDGFTSAGNGGFLSGVSIHAQDNQNGFVRLVGGDGGNGKTGAGGSGGSLSKNSVALNAPSGVDQRIFENAGNGGSGLIGGSGGSITGHKIVGFADAESIDQFLIAGIGGDGISGGGNGGSVTSFNPDFSTRVTGGDGGGFQIIAGSGGRAISGAGGSGGSISSINPFVPVGTTSGNNMAGDINFVAGNGGNGFTGGNGGSVSAFHNNPSSDSPGVLSVIAGSGGSGTRGNGGTGGSIADIVTPTKGTTRLSADLFPYPANGFTFGYDHLIAGDGGNSFASLGGSGGSVSAINSSASDDDFVVAAGRGGYGLYAGGIGGGVSNVTLGIGGVHKGLIVAGDGGSAGAFPETSTIPSLAFGGIVGKGGDGGSIVGYFQLGATASHTDLIAGNGGDTLNYGTVSDRAAGLYVGQGGSITNAHVSGTFGNTQAAVPIKSYNSILSGESMADFVTNNLRNPTAGGLGGRVDDSVGNEGIVVGASGRLKSAFAGYDGAGHAIYRSIPAFGTVNGNLDDISANAIMSAVAGSVDRIAAIHYVRNIQVLGNAIGTQDKGLDPANPEYYDKTGIHTAAHSFNAPTIDGALLDGALVTDRRVLNAQNQEITPGGRVFVIS